MSWSLLFLAGTFGSTGHCATAAVPEITFENTSVVTINDAGIATPYPSTITVSGQTAVVCKVTLTLNRLAHSFPSDLDVLLVAPNGQAVLVLSDVGNGTAVSEVNLTLDDGAASVLPEAGQLVSGTFKPTNTGNKLDGFPAPAPIGVYSASLASLSGIDPNGVWSLYINDDEALDGGLLAGGWSLGLTLTSLTTATALTSITNICPDFPATFSTTASGEGPFTYVWRRNGLVLAETNSILMLESVALSDAGAYSVEVSGFCNVVTNFATLAVAAPPLITIPPQNLTKAFGDVAQFSVTAVGVEPVSYQWQLNAAGIAGATGAALTVSNVSLAQNGDRYSVTVSNCAGSVTSAEAVLVVGPGLPIRAPVEGYSLANAFGDLKFEQPVLALSPPGETNRLFVIERSGLVMVVTNLGSPTKTAFLSLTSSTHAAYVEAGLLGMAFHPGYSSNRQFYIYRTLYTSTEGASNTLHWQVSEFKVSAENPDDAPTNSEVILISQKDESDEHNAGDIQFGPDGYLYVAMGDAGPPASELVDSKQPIDKSLFGGILRIDVDRRAGNLSPRAHPSSTTNYAIPSDNPFVGATSHLGLAVNPAEVRTEYYAIGFRNPFRMSFDPLSGELFVGDVGAGLFEEVDRVIAGGNYGWPNYEAHLLWLTTPTSANLQTPFVSYKHGNGSDQGDCVIGGIVCRDNPIAPLEGMYVFGDNVRGQIWAVPINGGTFTNGPFLRLTADPGLAAFARDPRDNGVLVVNVHDGTIKRLTYTAPESAPPFPQTLAETGVFTDLPELQLASRFVPYQIAVPFWSDHAIKSRWFALPDTNSVFGFEAETPWTLPAGTVWVKHFELELTNGVPSSKRRLETRLLVKTPESVYGVTYRWGDSRTDATLVPEDGLDEALVIVENGVVRTQVWHYPTRTECLACHNPATGGAIGFNAAQLNLDVPYHGGVTNQLLALSLAGYLNPAVTDAAVLPVLAHRTNSHFPISYRARSYLAANCSQCHQPNGGYTVGASWDARLGTRLSEAGILGRLMVPHTPDASLIWVRMASPGHSRMPPIATSELDQNGMELMRLWSESFPPEPWVTTDIGGVRREGHASVLDGVFSLSGAGPGVSGTNDSLSLLSMPLTGSCILIAQIADVLPTHPSAQAGIMFREQLGGGGQIAALMVDGDGQLFSHHRTARNQNATSTSMPVPPGQPWLSLKREGASVSAHHSDDGVSWTLAASNITSMTSTVHAGLAVAAHDSRALHAADFTNVQFATISVSSSASESVLTAPAEIPLSAQITSQGMVVSQVEYFVNGQSLGTAFEAPFNFTWIDAPAGQPPITARATFTSGATLESEPISILVDLDDAFVRFSGVDELTQGNWTNRHGASGAVIAGDSTNLPPDVYFLAYPSAAQTWEAPSEEPRALLRHGSMGRLAANWNSETNFSLDLWLGHGELSRIALYCVDWDTDNARSQRIEIVDPNNGTVLDTRELTSFSGGKYLIWSARGHLRIHITSTGTGTAVASGLFLDSALNSEPNVTLVQPTNGFNIALPAELTLTADASDSDGTVATVQFFVNGTKLGEQLTPPYTLVWTNLTAGTHTIKARAVDDLGDSRDSAPATISASLPAAQGGFIHVDALAQGDWIGRYGLDGFVLMAEHTNLPPYAELQATEASPFIFEWDSTNPSALLRPDAGSRVAACWFGNVFTLDLRLIDGHRHRVSCYVLDWLGGNRIMKIDLVDGDSGVNIHSETVSDFAGGKYLSWSLEGHVQLRFTITQGPNALISGLFFDPETNARPAVQLTAPAGQESVLAPSLYSLSASASDPDGIRKVEFFAEGVRVGERTNAPYHYIWSPLAGTYPVTAKAIDSLGAVQVSHSATLSVGLTNAAAVFTGTDEATRGNWTSIYGREAYLLVGAATNFPPHTWFASTNYRTFVIEFGSIDPRAPQLPDAPTRVASAAIPEPGDSIELTLRDGHHHQLALYFVDYGDNLRAQEISISDAATGSILDSRIVSQYSSGRHLTWDVRGRIRINLRSTNEFNALLQALFIDPAPGTFDTWRMDRFGASQFLNSNISGDLADPDIDGANNLVEYMSGTNPQWPGVTPPFKTRIVEGRLTFTFTKRKQARFLSFVTEVSADMAAWTDGQEHLELLPVVDLGDSEEFTYRSLFTMDESPMKFARIRVLRH